MKLNRNQVIVVNSFQLLLSRLEHVLSRSLLQLASPTLLAWIFIVIKMSSSSGGVLAASSTPINMIIVGGSSGMGKAAALETLEHGGKVLLVSRSEDKLANAKRELLESAPTAIIETKSLDITNESNVCEFANCLADQQWDSLIVSAAGKAVHGPVETIDTSDIRDMLDSKFWGAYYCAKYIGRKLKYGGSIVFVAGILNRRPGINCASLAIANGALEGLTRSLALEWGPRLRVNCLSPGFTDTERFDHMDPNKKQQMLANTAASLPLQKVGTPKDMGSALYYLATAAFATGVVLDVDGGHGIRQYANPTNDPMRANR
jgi:NAD(P)-dependent dehydrogenase (short-subunit alcohol dehydrogenase family)